MDIASRYPSPPAHRGSWRGAGSARTGTGEVEAAAAQVRRGDVGRHRPAARPGWVGRCGPEAGATAPSARTPRPCRHPPTLLPTPAPFRAGGPRSGRKDRRRAGCSRTASSHARSLSCGCAGPTAPASPRRSAPRRLRAGARPPAAAARGPSRARCPPPAPGRRSPTTRETGSRCWRRRRRVVRAWRRGARRGVASTSVRCPGWVPRRLRLPWGRRGAGPQRPAASPRARRPARIDGRAAPRQSTSAVFPCDRLGQPPCWEALVRTTPCRCWRRLRARPRWSAA